MRICCVVSGLGAGGAERVMVTMANHWTACGHEVHAVTLASAHAPAFSMDARIRVHHLGMAAGSQGIVSALRANAKRVRAVRSAVVEISPDAVIGYMDTTNVITILACLGLGLRVIVTEHTSPRFCPPGRLWNILRRMTYPLADTVVLQTNGALSCYPASIRRKAVILPNPIHCEEGGQEVDLPDGKVVMGMGRLSVEKGFDLLVQAFSRLSGKHPDWFLVIVGEGPLRGEIEKMARDMGIESRVMLPGFSSQPHSWLRRADLYVLSSRFEGFGNTLVEAMMCGLPVISTDCPSGPPEIVRDGIDGMLVENGSVPELCAAMDYLMSEPTVCQRFGKAAQDSAKRFGVEKVMARWERLLHSR